LINRKQNCDNSGQEQRAMAIEQMNISLSPQMARFIRGKVKNGEYTNMSEVVRDAVRRMQEVEATKSARTWLADFESSLTKGERESIRRGVRQGTKDIEEGRYEEYNADGLRNLAKDLVAASAKKLAGRSTAK
jgi:putative addiction module CopG family antidote